MPTLDDAFGAVRTALTRHFGAAADEFEGLAPFDAIVAVFLERSLGSARWRAAFDGLSDAGLLTSERLAGAEILELVDCVREQGVAATARTVAPLKYLARWVVDHGGRDDVLPVVDDTHRQPAAPGLLREELSAIKGIGPAGADALVLIGMKRPSYPVDRASFRVLVRHGWLESTATYDEARDLLVERAVDAEDEQQDHAAIALRELSYGMERLGRQFCRAAAPQCGGCPLEHLLPEGGPREVDA
jgi:endonuclease III related protein